MSPQKQQQQPGIAIVWREEWLPERLVIRHAPWQVRDRLSGSTVARYAAAVKAGGTLPAPRVARLPDGRLVLVDGWHRWEAGAVTRKLVSRAPEVLEVEGCWHVLAQVADLTEAEAEWQAAAANLTHGKQLKAKEIRNVFRKLVKTGQYINPANGKRRPLRELGCIIGRDFTTVRAWLIEDFPAVAREYQRGADAGQNPEPEQSPGRREAPDLVAEQVEQVRNGARHLARVAGMIRPGSRRWLIKALRDLIGELEKDEDQKMTDDDPF